MFMKGYGVWDVLWAAIFKNVGVLLEDKAMSEWWCGLKV